MLVVKVCAEVYHMRKSELIVSMARHYAILNKFLIPGVFAVFLSKGERFYAIDFNHTHSYACNDNFITIHHSEGTNSQNLLRDLNLLSDCKFQLVSNSGRSSIKNEYVTSIFRSRDFLFTILPFK